MISRNRPEATSGTREVQVRNGGAPAKQKMASSLADQIEDDIATAGWQVGALLGSEPDLIERYQVSRAIFREAVRLLEQREVALMRRGPGGGLLVTGPEPSVVSRSAATLLRYQNVDVAELSQARLEVELACLRLSVLRLDEADIAFLRGLVQEEEDMARGVGDTRQLRNFHVAVASLSGNKPLALFVGILTDLQAEFSPATIQSVDQEAGDGLTTGEVHASHTAHAGIVDAMVIGDAGLAVHRMRRHLQAISHFSSAYLSRPPAS